MKPRKGKAQSGAEFFSKSVKGLDEKDVERLCFVSIEVWGRKREWAYMKAGQRLFAQLDIKKTRR